MHRDVVTHVAVSSADFFMTGSTDGMLLILISALVESNRARCDGLCGSFEALNLEQTFVAAGHLKFWKKKGVGIEFVKHFRSHLGPIEGVAVSSMSRLS